MKIGTKITLGIAVIMVGTLSLPTPAERELNDKEDRGIPIDSSSQSKVDYRFNPPENSVGWDYSKSEWIVKRNGTFSEAEVEEIRRNLPDDKFLYTPGRARGYRSTEEKIEDYIEDNIDEIIENYDNR